RTLDAKIAEPVAHFTFHDLRRTFRTGLSTLKVAQDVAELCIAHRKSIRSTPNASPIMISDRIVSQSENGRSLAFFGPIASLTMSWWRSGGVILCQIAFISSLLMIARVRLSWSYPLGKSSFSAA